MEREPAVSGRFYPSSPRSLEAAIAECRDHVLGPRDSKVAVSGRLAALVLPHAGYQFSGPVVAWGMKRLSLENPLPKRILLLGPKHTPYGAKASLSAATGWKTPLGVVQVDEGLRKALADTGAFTMEDEAHRHEHSIEVEIPFLQDLYGKTPFSVVPLALQYSAFKDCCAWGAVIAKVLGDPGFKDVLLVVSSDFSHDTPREEAYEIDGQAIERILSMDARSFYDLVVTEDRSICGFIPISTAMVALKTLVGEKVKAARLAYSTSMDVMDHPRGVGYAAISFEEPSR